MRKLKFAIWILILYIFQTVFCGAININGTAPDFLLAFAVVFSFYERELKTTSLIVIICGVLSGSEVGRVFPATVIVTGVAGLIARGLFMSVKFIPKCIRVISVTIAAAFAVCAFEYFTVYKSISVYAVENNILPYVIYTTAAACIMYPIIKKTLFHVSDKKQLIV